MKKIISLFKRDYEGNRQVHDEVVPGAEWVIAGEGVATVKYDGTACMVDNGKLYKRFDRKLNKAAWRRKKQGHGGGPWALSDYKPAPDNWEPCNPEPDAHTGHWPGWVPVGDGPEDRWHREALDTFSRIRPGTHELVGPKIQGNPYNLNFHTLWVHGSRFSQEPPRDLDGLTGWFIDNEIEGIVWHHPDGRMVKIKRRDFGLKWPL